jgi:hypothetical protein
MLLLPLVVKISSEAAIGYASISNKRAEVREELAGPRLLYGPL